MYSILYPLDPSGPSDVSCCEMEGACQLSFQAFSSNFEFVMWAWQAESGTMGLWATLDCVWDVVDPFIYGTETITKSFFAVKWNQVFKKKCLLPPRSELLFQSFRIFPRFFLFWLISTVTIFQAHFSTNQQTAYTQHHQPPHTLLLVWRNACKHVCLGCIPKKPQSAWTGHKQGAIVSASEGLNGRLLEHCLQ